MQAMRRVIPWLVGCVCWCAGCGGCESASEEDAGLLVDTSDRDSSSLDGPNSDTARCEPVGDEVCNGLDDDCNGVADEGFTLRCSTTEDGVVAELTGDGFADGIVRNLLRGNDIGVALPSLPARNESIWVAASADDLVSRIRISDGVEVGRYIVGNNPSRTAVDGEGNAWVAMRGSLNDDGDPGEPLEGVVKIDGNCTPAVTPPLATRECVLLDLEDVGNLLRGVAIDARGDVWIGAHAGAEVIQLHGRTGEVLQRVPMDPFARPYGLAIDEAGYVWVAAVQGDVHVLRVDPVLGAVDVALDFDQLDRNTPYGIAADGIGGIWFGSQTANVFRVDAETFEVTHEHAIGRATRGVAVDDRGLVWAADSFQNMLVAADPESGEVLHEIPVGTGPVGVAVDHDGFVWAANVFSDDVTRVDPVSGDVLGTFPVGRTPYTYSDMTGSAFRVFRRLRGIFRGTYDVGAADARWTGVRVDAEIGTGTAQYRMRASDGSLEGVPFVDVDLTTGDASLDLRGRFLEVEIVLETEDRRSPPPAVEALRFDVELP